MPNTIASPYMGMPVPVPGVDPGPDWADNYNACLSITDAHNHAPGSGNPISQAGITLVADDTTFDSLNFNTSNAYNLRSVRFTDQVTALGLATDIGCMYEAGGELYYNDSSGNQVQITSGGSVNATSSGISSGTASASFVSSVLVVLRAAATPANIKGASILLGNNVANSKYLTLQPPNAMGADYSLTLPSIPAGTRIMTLDTSGNMAGAYSVDGSTITISSNVIGVPAGGIGTTQLAASSVTSAKVASNIDLPGNLVTENAKAVVVSNTNASASLAVVRIRVTNSAFVATVISGEGATAAASLTDVGKCTITYSSAFADTPTVILTGEGVRDGVGHPTGICVAQVSSNTSSSCVVSTYGESGGVISSASGTFGLIAIGKRA